MSSAKVVMVASCLSACFQTPERSLAGMIDAMKRYASLARETATVSSSSVLLLLVDDDVDDG